MSELHIITVATDSKYYFPYLIKSCKKHGKKLTVLGMGEKWEGLNSKLLKMINYLKSLPPNDIVCFVDGYDVICCRNLDELKNSFLEIIKKTKKKLIVGHDKRSFFMNIISSLYFGKCKDISINSGTYIGYVSNVLRIVQNIYKLNPNNNTSDQLLMTEYCNQTNEIYCDTESELFLTLLYPLEELDKYVNIDINKNLSYKSKQPFFIHAPGNGYLDNIINKLGYSIELNKINNELFYIFYKKIFLYIIFFIKKYFIIFLILFFIIIFIIFYKLKCRVLSDRSNIKKLNRFRKNFKYNSKK